MQKILSSNTLLKILSVVIAVVSWAYIIIIIDAPTEKTFRDVPITTVNDQLLSNNGYCIERLSVQTASVRIEGSRKVIANFSSSNISAVLDFSDINTSRLASEGVITVNLSVDSEFGEIVSFTPSAVDVYVEDTKYKDIDIRYTTVGEAQSGYVFGDIALSQDKIRIFGAQSHIDNVSYASVNVDLINTDYLQYSEGMFRQECTVRLYDAADKELSERDIKWIWNNTPVISVSCPIYKTKAVRVVPSVDDTVDLSALKCGPSEVVIYGNNDYIEGVSEVSTETVTVSDFLSGGEVTKKLILPDWAKAVDDISEVKISANSD